MSFLKKWHDYQKEYAIYKLHNKTINNKKISEYFQFQIGDPFFTYIIYIFLKFNYPKILIEYEASSLKVY